MSRARLWFLVALATVGAAGLGCSERAVTPRAPARDSVGAATLDAPSGFAERSGNRAPASAVAPSVAELDVAPERRGLGTEWGETRASAVHDVTFVRDSASPFAVATLQYDDRRGVEALAQRHTRRERTLPVAARGAITIAVLDAAGRPLEAVHVGDRTFVIGEPGERYSVRVQNHTEGRVEAVATVDGLDVISGAEGSVARRGYVLGPYATLDIEGFRKSSSAVAAFRFAPIARSYAAETGRPRNVGVIGVAVFSEQGDTASRADLRLRDTASPFPNDGRYAPPPRGR